MTDEMCSDSQIRLSSIEEPKSETDGPECMWFVGTFHESGVTHCGSSGALEVRSSSTRMEQMSTSLKAELWALCDWDP